MCVALFITGCIIGMVQILKPEYLTPMAEQLLTSQIRGQVRMSRMLLTFDGNFPHLKLEIDSLAILSDDVLQLPEAERRQIPAYADTVVSINHLRGSLNISRLATNTVALGDIVIDGPGVNIVDIRPELGNYDIFYASEDTVATTLPRIEMHRFSIINPRRICYHNLQTGTYTEIGLKKVQLDGATAPVYGLALSGTADCPAWGRYSLEHVAFGLDGGIKYDFATPSRFGLEKFTVWFDQVKMHISTDLDLTEGLVVNTLDFNLDPLPISTVVQYIPQPYRRQMGLHKLRTDATVSLRAVLEAPYNPTVHLFPHMRLSLLIPPCYIQYGDFRLKRADLSIGLLFDGDDLNHAVIDISRLSAYGANGAINMTFSGRATNLLADPDIDARLQGRIDLGRLSWLPPLIQTQIQGIIEADARIKGRRSMLSRQHFHELQASGTLNIHDLYAVTYDTVNMVAITHGRIHLGTSETFVHDRLRAANLLSLSASIDSGRVMHSDISMRFSRLRAGIGTTNDAHSADTSRINPIGGTVSVGNFRLDMLTDSLGCIIRDGLIYGSMTRYKEQGREPLFTLHVSGKKCAAGTPEARLLLSDLRTTLRAHKRQHRTRQARLQRVRDSLRVVHPYMSEDSIYALALQRHNRQRHLPRFVDSLEASTGHEVVNFNIASGFGALLRDWDISGDLTAAQARLFTPYFPLRNRLSNINIHYSDDSLQFNNIEYKVGRSDLAISGLVSNMRPAFLSRFRRPIRINVDVRSDTIDVNQLAEAFFRGGAYADSRSRLHLDLEALTDEKALEDHTSAAASDSVGPLIVPYNLDATLKIRSRHIIYSDFTLNDFTGDLLVYHGAINLSGLHASSAVGSVDLTALYSAPSASDMSFGMGLQLHRFNIDRFLKMVPVIDTIMPIMRDIGGIINVDIAATTPIDRQMNFVLPQLRAAIKIQGDSLTVIDPETFKTMAKWLLFRDKNKNLIDSMTAQLLVEDNTLRIYPFIFNFDRYRLGVMGWMNLDDQYEYHIGVLKSPIPFKFGINIKGHGDKMKIRLGGNKINKKSMESYPVAVVDTTRVNLINEIRSVFRRGIRGARLGSVRMAPTPDAMHINLDTDTLTHADSLRYIQEGLIPAPEGMKNEK